jgi:hypothetical protein
MRGVVFMHLKYRLQCYFWKFRVSWLERTGGVETKRERNEGESQTGRGGRVRQKERNPRNKCAGKRLYTRDNRTQTRVRALPHSRSQEEANDCLCSIRWAESRIHAPFTNITAAQWACSVYHRLLVFQSDLTQQLWLRMVFRSCTINAIRLAMGLNVIRSMMSYSRLKAMIMLQ